MNQKCGVRNKTWRSDGQSMVLKVEARLHADFPVAQSFQVKNAHCECCSQVLLSWKDTHGT